MRQRKLLVSIPQPDGDTGSWFLALAGGLISGAFAVAGAALKQLWGQVAILHKRIDDTIVKLDSATGSTEGLIDRRHHDNLVAIADLRTAVDEIRKENFTFQIHMTERLATMATGADIKGAVDRILLSLPPAPRFSPLSRMTASTDSAD